MRRLSHVLPDAIERREVLRSARVQRILQNWPEIVGPELAKRSTPDRFEKGTVWVSVRGSAWAQELRMLEPTILAKIAEYSGDPNLVQDLRFGVRAPREKPEGMQVVEPPSIDPELEHLSIREIKERRLKRWKDAEATDS